MKKPNTENSSSQSQVLREHLFAAHAQMIANGTYRRLPEFKEMKIILNDAQRLRLSEAIQEELKPSSFAAIAMMAQRFIEHELILVRAPRPNEVLEEIRLICLDAISCLQILKKLQLTFNSDQGELAPPEFLLSDATSGVSGPPDARTAAVDQIKRVLDQPIPLTLELGPLILACFNAHEQHSSKTGPKGESYLTLFLVCLTNSARACKRGPTLPSNDAFSKNGSQVTTRFFDFVRVGLVTLEELGNVALVHETISKEEKETVLRALRGYRNMSNGQLLSKLRPIKNMTASGLAEFIAHAVKEDPRVDSGSTQPDLNRGARR